MLSLRELQTRFVEDIFAAGVAAGDGYIRSDGINASPRIDIYRNNVFSNYREALSAVYPVVESLVGEAFFRQAADSYIGAYPSTSGDLNDYGADFAGFLASFPPAAQLTYLPDVARLEWLAEAVFHEADHAPLPLSKLAAVSAERYGELHFTLHPACRIFESAYPVARIWQVNQPDWQDDCSVDLATGGCRLLVCRENFVVVVKPLTGGEFALLNTLADQAGIAAAYELACAEQADFELDVFLQTMIGMGILVDVDLP